MSKNVNHLRWIFNRMVNVHNENPKADYMVEFKKIIDSQNSGTCENCKFSILEQVMSDTALYQCGNCESETYTRIYDKSDGCDKWEKKDEKQI